MCNHGLWDVNCAEWWPVGSKAAYMCQAITHTLVFMFMTCFPVAFRLDTVLAARLYVEKILPSIKFLKDVKTKTGCDLFSQASWNSLPCFYDTSSQVWIE